MIRFTVHGIFKDVRKCFYFTNRSKRMNEMKKGICSGSISGHSSLFGKNLILLGVLCLGACSSTIPNSAKLGFDKLSWFNGDEKSQIVLPKDPQMLANGDPVQVAIYNAVELSDAKRFDEARQLLSEVRELQVRNSDGYRAVTCAMAILALRSGDIKTFNITAHQLDASLGSPVTVSPSYVEVISLYRALNDRPLPVNVPEGIKRFKEKNFPLNKNA